MALEDILWEAPKPQQVWFIKQFGCNVNLGNIAPNDLIPPSAFASASGATRSSTSCRKS